MVIEDDGKLEFNRKPDPIDQASELSQTLNDAYVGQARAKAKPEQVQNPDGTWPHTECVDCDTEIPEGRLKLGKIRCIRCQEDIERVGRAR